MFNASNTGLFRSGEIEEIFEKTWCSKFENECVNFGGCFLLDSFGDFLKDVQRMEVFDSDVWITSFPKCGTTWMQEMVWLIVHNLDYNGAKESLKARSPFLEITPILNFNAIDKTKKVKIDINCNQTPEYLRDSLGYITNLRGKTRCIKTHLPWNLLPIAIRQKTAKPKIIHVTRNPKDACVSYYYHLCRLYDLECTVEEFSKLFIGEKIFYTPYWSNMFSYYDQIAEPNVLFVKFEDMKTDLRDVVQEVATFLGRRRLDDHEMNRLLNHLSFDAMKNNDAVNNTQTFVNAHKNRQAVPFIRKGIVGDHKNVMSVEMIEVFDDWIKKNGRGLFYEEACSKDGVVKMY